MNEAFNGKQSQSAERNYNIKEASASLIQNSFDNCYRSFNTLSRRNTDKFDPQEDGMERSQNKSSSKRIKLLLSSFTVTKKQLNHKYNYNDLKSLEKM
jgi:hypothetical protein